MVSAFESGCENARGQFWKKFAERRNAKRFSAKFPELAEGSVRPRPLVKICGITRVEDGILAAELGANMLGFVFSTTKRLTTEEFVTSFSTKLRAGGNPVPLLVGVITDPNSEEGKTAIKLAQEGVLDAVQFHGVDPHDSGNAALPCYCAARVGSPEDFDYVANLRKNGEPRVLLDAKVEGIPGGTGKTIPESLLREKASGLPLWLAGGINPDNVATICEKFHPELIDISSGIEDAPGIKNHEKMRALFAAL